MNTIEIVAGALLILTCIVIVVAVALQSSSGGDLSAIMGGDSSAAARGKAKDRDAKLAKITKILAIVLFIVTFGVNIIALATK